MRGSLPVLAVLAAAWAAGPALAQSKNERLDALESRMDGVERQLANQGLLEMSRQIDALNEELRRLRGDFETLQHSVEAAGGFSGPLGLSGRVSPFQRLE